MYYINTNLSIQTQDSEFKAAPFNQMEILLYI